MNLSFARACSVLCRGAARTSRPASSSRVHHGVRSTSASSGRPRSGRERARDRRVASATPQRDEPCRDGRFTLLGLTPGHLHDLGRGVGVRRGRRSRAWSWFRVRRSGIAFRLVRTLQTIGSTRASSECVSARVGQRHVHGGPVTAARATSRANRRRGLPTTRGYGARRRLPRSRDLVRQLRQRPWCAAARSTTRCSITTRCRFRKV